MSHGPPALIGTRGRFTDNPPDHENVLPSLNNSPAWVDGVYITIRNTSDNVPILMHDSTVDRTTNGTGAVNSLTLSQLKALDAGDGAEVPTLGEYLQGILDLESNEPNRRTLSRIFINPRSLSASQISATYNMAMDSAFTSLTSRYSWTFNLLVTTTGADNLRLLDQNAAIATFFGPFTSADGPDKTTEIIGLADDVDAATILAYPASQASYPDALSTLASEGYEVGVSRDNDLGHIATLYRNEHVDVLFTWRTDELTYWNSDAPLAVLTGHASGARADPSHVLG